MKRWDQRGLEGLPLKLMIVTLLVSLSAPAVLGATEGFERSTAGAALETEARSLAALAEEVLRAGEGNRRIGTVDVPGDGDMSMVIGGDIAETESLSIRCIQGSQVIVTVMLDHPTVRLRPPNGIPLVLGAGEHELLLSCVNEDARLMVEVEAIG